MTLKSWLSPFLILSLTAPASAFSIQPGAQVARVAAGKTMTVNFEIVNDQEEPLRVRSRIRDAYVLPENKAFPAESWLEPLFQEVTVPAKKSKKVQFRVKAPAQAQGELAALVSFVPDVKEPEKPVDEKGGIQTRIVTLITVSLYVRIKGTEKGEADLGAVHVANRAGVGSNTEERIETSVVVKNSGNVHLRPSGRFEIVKKGETQPLHTLAFASGWPVMPQSDYAYTAHVPGKLAAGKYLLNTKVSFGPETSLSRQTAFTMTLTGDATDYVESK